MVGRRHGTIRRIVVTMHSRYERVTKATHPSPMFFSGKLGREEGDERFHFIASRLRLNRPPGSVCFPL